MSAVTTLSGLDGSNPLAFLAAVGTLRVLDLQLPDAGVRMGWQLGCGTWQPSIACRTGALDADAIVDALDAYLANPPQAEFLQSIGLDLTVSGQRFRSLASSALSANSGTANANLRRVPADFAAAFGCDALTQDESPDSLIQDTALRTMSGAGHQHFLQFMREIIASTDAGHIKRALFDVWTYQDEGRGKNLRWDPRDDRRYALRWKNPSSDPNTTVRGANRLAIEGLALLTTAPVRGRLETTGFVQRRGKGACWTWPIWLPYINVDVCRSLLQLAAIHESTDRRAEEEERYAALKSRGIAALFQSRRITTGKYRSFSPAVSVFG